MPGIIYLDYLIIFAILVLAMFDLNFSKPLQPWQLNEAICPPALCGQPSKGAFSAKNPLGQRQAFPFFEGDIVLESQLDSMKRQPRRQKRGIAKPLKRLWKNGIVPYQLDSSLTKKAKKLIKLALKYLQRKTCIKFRFKRKTDKNFIKYINQPGCWSFVGMKGGAQLLSVGQGCESIGVIIHETGHALGFWHEQSRPDRDNYVKIIWGNISPRYFKQFGKRNNSESESRGYAYDYNSVMHYGSRDFSRTAKRTIKIIGTGKNLKFRIGQRKRLSPLDIAQLKSMYNCNRNHKDTKSCFKSKFKDGRDYRGRLDYTKQGYACQRWSDQYPHRHTLYAGNRTIDRRYGLGRHNYCRNPGGKRSRPWCFTSLQRLTWFYCDIKICNTS